MAALLLTGCASSVSGTADGIRIARVEDVEHCEYLGDVHGISSFYGVFAAPALQSSRRAAMAEARKVGAKHLVRNAADPSYGFTSVHCDYYDGEYSLSGVR